MTRTSWAGVALVGIGLVTLVLDYAALHFFPQEWGGPNIGAGFLILLSLGLCAGGALLFVRGRPGRG